MDDKTKNVNGQKDGKSADQSGQQAPKKKKLAVVFHSQNSANHKNHTLGVLGKKTPAGEKDEKKRVSPNGRPLPPGTARVTPLRELEQQEKQRQAEAEKKAAEAAAKREAERAAAEAAGASASQPVASSTETSPADGAGAASTAAKANAQAGTEKDGKTAAAATAAVEKKPTDIALANEKKAAGEAPAVSQAKTDAVKKEAPAEKTAVKPSKPTPTKLSSGNAEIARELRAASQHSFDGRSSRGGFSADGRRGQGTRTGDRTGRGFEGRDGQRTGTGAGRPSFGSRDGQRTGTQRPSFGSRDGGFTRTGDRTGQQRPGQRAGFGRRDSVESADTLSQKPSAGRTAPDAKKPQKKAAFAKNYENEKAEAAKRSRNNRKQNKYGAEQSYEREDEVVHKSKKTGKGAFIKPEVKAPVEEEIKAITIPEVITLKDLSDKMKVKPADIIKKLFMQGKMVTLNTELSYEDAENIAVDYDILCEKEEKVDVIAELVKDDVEDSDEELITRPPVVCVMGHVDHGKTSILDAIRKTNVTAKEAGGITQSIGAYQVKVKVNGEDRIITFLDTPGHEAFTAMRMRGAQSTDIAVLVVAADDGVMPQTIEAIHHAKAANTPIIVAINKMDKPTANPDKVKQELMKYDLVPEEYGGDTICVPVSAKSGMGLEDLLENIALEADVMELRANPDRAAYGVVIEAELDKGRGSVARLLVQKGTLHQGDIVAVGAAYGKVRAMTDDKGKRIKKAGPSQPCEILGLNAVPNAGEIFQVKDSEKDAKAYAAAFVTENKAKMIEESKKKVSLDALFDQIKAGEVKELPIVIKADVQGSVEALKDSLEKIKNDEVAVKVIHSGVGAINESDVELAAASNAIVIGFDVKPSAVAKDIADREHVDVRLYDVIYNAIDDVEAAMKGMLKPIFEEKVIGHAEIRQIFKASGVGNIAGCMVKDGLVQRGAKARITRGGDQIFDGEIASVKRFKDDVKEVKAGYECGLVFDGFNDIAVDDVVEVYVMEEVKRV